MYLVSFNHRNDADLLIFRLKQSKLFILLFSRLFDKLNMLLTLRFIGILATDQMLYDLANKHVKDLVRHFMDFCFY